MDYSIKYIKSICKCNWYLDDTMKVVYTDLDVGKLYSFAVQHDPYFNDISYSIMDKLDPGHRLYYYDYVSKLDTVPERDCLFSAFFYSEKEMIQLKLDYLING